MLFCFFNNNFLKKKKKKKKKNQRYSFFQIIYHCWILFDMFRNWLSPIFLFIILSHFYAVWLSKDFPKIHLSSLFLLIMTIFFMIKSRRVSQREENNYENENKRRVHSLIHETVTSVQILDMVDCILLRVNVLGKKYESMCFSPTMGKYLDRLGSLTLVWQPVYEKVNSKFKPAVLCFKIDLILHPVCDEGFM